MQLHLGLLIALWGVCMQDVFTVAIGILIEWINIDED